MIDPWSSAAELAHQVRARALSALDVADAALERIRRLDLHLNAFIRVDPAAVRQRARAIDARPDPGPLAGVPVAIKDNLCVQGSPTTAASRALRDHRPPYDATAVERLTRAGALILGKTNLDEFGMGATSAHSALGPTRNPHDTTRAAGGSSGGSAAAVAAGLVPLALGSDTGGSIRLPAAWSGCVGLKPTYGLVPRHGLIAFASSLDHIGPLARSVRDAALCLHTIAGPDPRDMTSRDTAHPLHPLDPPPLDTLTFGILPHHWTDPHTTSVLDLLRTTPLELPAERAGIATYHVLATAEASSNLHRYDGVHLSTRTPASDLATLTRRSRTQHLGPEVQRRLLLGAYVLSADAYDDTVARAYAARRQWTEQLDHALTQVDAILTPTAPSPAWPLHTDAQPIDEYDLDRFTVGANLAGNPAISLPCGLGPDQLPRAIQLIGRRGHDAQLLAIAAALEAALPPTPRPQVPA